MERLIFALTFLLQRSARRSSPAFSLPSRLSSCAHWLTAFCRGRRRHAVHQCCGVEPGVLCRLLRDGRTVSLALAVAALVGWSVPYLLAGSLLYLVGTILVTIVFNVPLNNRLASVTPDSTEGAGLWTRYLSTWTA